MRFEFAHEYPIHRPFITSQGDIFGDVLDSIDDEEEDIAVSMSAKRYCSWRNTYGTLR